MEDVSNPNKKVRILSLLKALSEKKQACQLEQGTLAIVAGHIVYGATGPITREHHQLLSQLEEDGVLTASDKIYIVNDAMIPKGTAPMPDLEVLELLLNAIGWHYLLDFLERQRESHPPESIPGGGRE